MANECGVLGRYYSIAPLDDPKNHYIETAENLKNLPDMLADCDACGGYVVKVVYMTEDEYKSLPEFAGF